MDRPVKFFECLYPVTACNLKCEYCYVIQEERRWNKIENLLYPVETMLKGLTKERLGGICFFSICGAGETLVPDEIIPLIYGLLKEGHYVNITTNGTIVKKFNQILEFPSEFQERLHFSFSLHYKELKQRNLLSVFKDNVKKIQKTKKISFFVQFNMYDGYLPYLEEIKNFCIENFGAPPQICATRNMRTPEVELLTSKNKTEYFNLGKDFNSKLFEMTNRQFMKKQTHFCYAGRFTYSLDLKTGILKPCYCSSIKQNIFEDLTSPILDCPVGFNCTDPYCFNSSHFISLGTVPDIDCPSYGELRNRPEAKWQTKKIKEFLSQKFYKNFPNKIIDKKYEKIASELYLQKNLISKIEQENSCLRNQNNELLNKINENSNTIDKITIEKQAIQNEKDAILNSASYKITKPLRFVKKVAKKILRRK